MWYDRDLIAGRLSVGEAIGLLFMSQPFVITAAFLLGTAQPISTDTLAWFVGVPVLLCNLPFLAMVVSAAVHHSGVTRTREAREAMVGVLVAVVLLYFVAAVFVGMAESLLEYQGRMAANILGLLILLLVGGLGFMFGSSWREQRQEDAWSRWEKEVLPDVVKRRYTTLARDAFSRWGNEEGRRMYLRMLLESQRDSLERQRESIGDLRRQLRQLERQQ